MPAPPNPVVGRARDYSHRQTVTQETVWRLLRLRFLLLRLEFFDRRPRRQIPADQAGIIRRETIGAKKRRSARRPHAAPRALGENAGAAGWEPPDAHVFELLPL